MSKKGVYKKMGKKKNKYKDYDSSAIDFDDKESVLRYLDGLMGETSSCTSTHVSDNIDAISYSMAGVDAAKAAYPDIDTNPAVKSYQAVPAGRYTDTKKETIPVQPVSKTYPGIHACNGHSDYGNAGKALQVVRCTAGGFQAGSYVVPMYELGSSGFNPFSITEDAISDNDWTIVLYDLAILSALRFEPDAVYPYNPEGISKLVSVLNKADKDSVVSILVGSSIQCYIIDSEVLREHFIDQVNYFIKNAGFEVDRLRLVYDMIGGTDISAGIYPVYIVYDESRGSTANTVFERSVTKAGVNNNISDLNSILVDSSAYIESLITDITMALSPNLNDVLNAANDADNEPDDDSDEDAFSPYGKCDYYPAGGASNDNEPFLAGSDEKGNEEQKSNYSGEDDAATDRSVRESSEHYAGERGHNSQSFGTTIGAVFKSKGITLPGEEETSGDTGGYRADDKQLEEEQKETGVQVLGHRDNDEEQRQEKEKEEVKEEGNMVISVTTVGR